MLGFYETFEWLQEHGKGRQIIDDEAHRFLEFGVVWEEDAEWR
jgi:hypothetical protein